MKTTMKPRYQHQAVSLYAQTNPANPSHQRLRQAGGSWLLSALLLSAVPAAVKAQFTYMTNNGTITITGYTGSGGAVTIPSTTNGLPVTSIGTNSFYACHSLTSVIIPDSVTNIGDYAFAVCINLTNVTIGNSVTNIGDEAFTACNSLAAITVDPLNSFYSSVAGVLFNKSQTTLIQYPVGAAGNYTIPNNVTSIGDGAFEEYHGLTNVTIGNNVTNIGLGAFQLCTNLTSVTIGNNVTSIEPDTFNDCFKLASVTIGNGVTSIGFNAFGWCGDLTNVTIPNSVTNIGEMAFTLCTSLASVTIGNSVTSIGTNTFLICQSLASVFFEGNAPTSVASSVFSGDYNITVYYLPWTTGWGKLFGDRPTALWTLPDPVIVNNSLSFGGQTNGFGFSIGWATNIAAVVEACTNFVNPVWQPLQTNTFIRGLSYFSDPQWTNYPCRFYRVRTQ